MNSETLKINELKKIIIKRIKKLDKHRYAERCITQLEAHPPAFKNAEDSETAKVEGNTLYSQKDLTFAQLYKILVLFNKSIAFAPNNSTELVIAYTNKSALLQRMRKYRECIFEIDQALRITGSNILRIKLLCRKAECLAALGSSDSRTYLEKAKFIETKLEDSEREKCMISKLINKTQLILNEGKLDIPKDDKRVIQGLKMIEESEKRDLSESIRVEYSEIYKWHLVAARDYKPGEIILTTKPYLNSLDDSRAYHYCDHCFNFLWTAVPCDQCPRRVYCSEECKTQAWNDHHGMECFTLSFMQVAFESQWNGLIPLG